MYSADRIAPCRDEALQIGCKELTSSTDVADALANSETALVLINSVCGCAARVARPALKHAVENSSDAPSALFTVFAGVDVEATEHVRSLCEDMPSSPSYALFKNGEFKELIGRQCIEGYPLEMVSAVLAGAFEKHFGSDS